MGVFVMIIRAVLVLNPPSSPLLDICLSSLPASSVAQFRPQMHTHGLYLTCLHAPPMVLMDEQDTQQEVSCSEQVTSHRLALFVLSTVQTPKRLSERGFQVSAAQRTKLINALYLPLHMYSHSPLPRTRSRALWERLRLTKQAHGGAGIIPQPHSPVHLCEHRYRAVRDREGVPRNSNSGRKRVSFQGYGYLAAEAAQKCNCSMSRGAMLCTGERGEERGNRGGKGAGLLLYSFFLTSCSVMPRWGTTKGLMTCL